MTYIQNTPEELNAWVDWLYGKEAEDGALGNAARFVRQHVTRRPAVGSQARWANFDALYSIQAYYRQITAADLDASIEAFRADMDG